MFLDINIALCAIVILSGSIVLAYHLGQFISLYIKHGPHREKDGTSHPKLAKTVAEEVGRMLTMAGGEV